MQRSWTAGPLHHDTPDRRESMSPTSIRGVTQGGPNPLGLARGELTCPRPLTPYATLCQPRDTSHRGARDPTSFCHRCLPQLSSHHVPSYRPCLRLFAPLLPITQPHLTSLSSPLSAISLLTTDIITRHDTSRHHNHIHHTCTTLARPVHGTTICRWSCLLLACLASRISATGKSQTLHALLLAFICLSGCTASLKAFLYCLDEGTPHTKPWTLCLCPLFLRVPRRRSATPCLWYL